MAEVIDIIDDLIHKSESNDEPNNDLFTDITFPKAVLNKMWSYLIDEAPFDDVLVLTCKAFRDLTYHHPSHGSRFHFRLEPNFDLNSPDTNHNKFQIGAAVTPATKRAIIVKSVEDAIINNKNITFPFHSLKVFNVADSCQIKDVMPFFAEFKNNIKFMSWNSCKFLNQNITYSNAKEVIQHPFTECTLFSLLTRRRWHASINLNSKFPRLLCFSYTIEWYSHFDLIQQFLDSHPSIVILFLDFNFKIKANELQRWREEALDPDNTNPTRLKLTLPANVEICVLSCLDAESAKYIDIDFSACRHKLKQLVCLRNTMKMCNPMFLDGKGNKMLQFLVINDMDGIHAIQWKHLKIGTRTINRIDNIYVPCTPVFAKKISTCCVGEFPDLEQVKEAIESVGARQVLRDLNCEQRRHWLWGLFWFERHGIGMKKLKQLETHWIDMERTAKC